MKQKKQDNWITVAKAAELLGVTTQSIRNWGAKGLLRTQEIKSASRTKIKYDNKQVLALKDDLVRIHESELTHDQYEAEIKTLIKESKDKAAAIEELIKVYDKLPDVIESFNQFQMKVYKTSDRCMAKYESILSLYLHRTPIEEIAKEFGYSPLRVKEIVLHSMNLLNQEITSRTEEWESFKDLKAQIASLQTENATLKEELKKYLNAKAKKELQADTDILYRSCDEFLNCGFSVRTLNCLHQADLDTLQDVLQYGKKELLRIRNFGKTSLAEVEALFKKYGIEFD